MTTGRHLGLVVVAALALAGCDSRSDQVEAPPASPAASATDRPEPHAATASWHLISRGADVTLALMPAQGPATIRLICPAEAQTLIVNVPGFQPIGSEERLSFGSGGEVEALVADTNGDAQRGGVSGTGAVPDNLAALVGGPLSATYGAQTSGPHPAPPPNLSAAFLAACRGGSDPAARPAPQPPAPAGACMMQGDERLRVVPLRAVGTEPFWGARIEGRCVTYSHPEDQVGTRIWARYTARPDGGTWSGALDGQTFELRTRAAPGCSDGMSDRRYPIAVELTVGGEQRTGCAEPA